MRLLLDAHVGKAAVIALQRKCPAVDVVHISDWRGSAFRSADDATILRACFQESRVLLTYDLRTIPGLLRQWAVEERPHAGVIFADARSVPPDNPGALSLALVKLVDECGDNDFTNVVRFLRPRSGNR